MQRTTNTFSTGNMITSKSNPIATTKNNNAYGGDFHSTDHQSKTPRSTSTISAPLPDTPSPVCSNASSLTFASFSSTYDVLSSDSTTEFSSSRFQSMDSRVIKPSTTSLESSERKHHSRTLGSFFKSNPPRNAEQAKSLKRTQSRLQPAKTTAGHQREIMKVASFVEGDKIREENDEEHEKGRYQSEASSIYGGYRLLLARPRPYIEFLDEVQAQERQAQLEALRKEKHRIVMDEFRGKEAAIRDWESKRMAKANKAMEEKEMKLEKKRAKAQERAEKRIAKARKKANVKAAVLRQSTAKKLAEVNEITDVRSSKDPVCQKLSCLCSNSQRVYAQES